MTHAASARADLSPALRDLQERARNYVDDVLIPLEEKAERAGGPLPDDDVPAHPRDGARGRAGGGPAQPRSRRTGVVDDRVAAGRGAVRPQHQRHQLVHAHRLQRLEVGQPTADRPLAAPSPQGRAARRVRRHGGRGRVRPVRDRHRRAPH